MSESTGRARLIVPELLADGLGGNAVSGQAVLVRDGRIEAVGAALALKKDLPPDVETVTLEGQCLTPGLIVSADEYRSRA